jgi:hypothetical protein
MKPEVDERHGIIFLRGDASKYTPEPVDADTLRRRQEYREMLRQFAPKEYEELIKQREEYLRKRQLQKAKEANE